MSASTEAELEIQTPTEPVLIVAVGARSFGIPLEPVREVLTARPITRLPGAADAVPGIVNLRGRLVTVADLGTLLSGAAAVTRASHRVVVLERGGRQVGLAVEEVSRIVRFDPDALGPVPPGQEVDGALGSAEVEGIPFTLLDTDPLLRPILG